MNYIFTILIIFSIIFNNIYGCKDILKDCRRYKNNCKSLSWRQFLANNCPYTCKMCPHDLNNKDGQEECEDIGENCDSIKFHCKDVRYKNIAMNLCKRSCELC